MKKKFNGTNIGVLSLTTMLFLTQMAAIAQEKITVDTGEAKSWLSDNWMWVAGIALLLIIVFAAGSSRRRRTTTVRDNTTGNTTTTTTTIED